MDMAAYGKFLAEGEKLEQAGSFDQAMACYNKALASVSPQDILRVREGRNALLARARCFLVLGNHEASLKDADRILEDDPTFMKGIFSKAEALYFRGDFENALIFFHRGQKMRPDVTDFRLGINKSREAIINAIGSVDVCKLERTVPRADAQDRHAGVKSGASHRNNAPVAARASKAVAAKAGSDKTVKQLLGELYADSVYLEELMADPMLAGSKVKGIVAEGIDYLDKRVDFWRQQKPIYARQHEVMQRTMRATMKKTQPLNSTSARNGKPLGGESAAGVQRAYAEVLQALDTDDYDRAVKLGAPLVRQLEQGSGNDPVLLGEVYSTLGTAHLELGHLDAALELHTKDYGLARLHGAPYRGLANLGRVHAVRREFQKAIERWLECVPLAVQSVDSAWLYHEIGRCYMELDNAVSACEFGQKAKDAALDAGDKRWQLYATVLVAQASVRLGDLHPGQRGFQEALQLAAALADSRTEMALKRALAAVNDKLVEGATASRFDDDDDA